MNQESLNELIRHMRKEYPNGIPVENLRIESQMRPGRPMGKRVQYDKLKLVTLHDLVTMDRRTLK